MDKPDISKVKVGDKVYGWGEKRAYTVMARNDRWVIISKPFNPTKTFQNYIIDIRDLTAYKVNEEYARDPTDYGNHESCKVLLTLIFSKHVKLYMEKVTIDVDDIVSVN